MLCLMLAGACAAGTERSADEPTKQETDLRQKDGEELVEITIRMPDGRVIKRKERKIASRVEGDLPVLNENRPPIVSKRTTGDIETLDGGVSGGSNAGGSQTGGGSAGGGGSSTSHAGGGGGGHAGGFTGGSGGSLDDGSVPDVYDTSLLLDEDRSVWIYAWKDTGGPFHNITYNIIVNPRNKTPERLAQLVAEEVQIRSPRRIVLRLWKEFIPAERHPFDPSDPIGLLRSGGYRDGLVEYWTAFAESLASRGVRPDIVILDQEEGIEFGRIAPQYRENFFSTIMSTPSPVTADAPLLMRQITYDQFRVYRSTHGRPARDEYHAYAIKFRSTFLREVFSTAFQSAYDEYIPICNYNEVDTSFSSYRYSGLPIPSVTMTGISMPVCYLRAMPTWGRYNSTNKDVRWNVLIDNLNRCRSAAANGPVVPWIAPPGFGIRGQDTWATVSEIPQEMDLWEMQMRHLMAMGIDNYMLWNPISRFNPNANLTDRMLDDWLAANSTVPTQLITDLPEIPLDADQIVTNGVVTTYDEFLNMMNISDDE